MENESPQRDRNALKTMHLVQSPPPRSSVSPTVCIPLVRREPRTAARDPRQQQRAAKDVTDACTSARPCQIRTRETFPSVNAERLPSSLRDAVSAERELRQPQKETVSLSLDSGPVAEDDEDTSTPPRTARDSESECGEKPHPEPDVMSMPCSALDMEETIPDSRVRAETCPALEMEETVKEKTISALEIMDENRASSVIGEKTSPVPNTVKTSPAPDNRKETSPTSEIEAETTLPPSR